MPLVSEEKWINFTVDTVRHYVSQLKNIGLSKRQICEKLDNFIVDFIGSGPLFMNKDDVINNFDIFISTHGNYFCADYVENFTLQDVLDMVPPGIHPKDIAISYDSIIEGTYIQKNYNYYNELELYNIANKEYEIDKVNYNEKMKQWKADKMAFELTLANKLEKLKMEL